MNACEKSDYTRLYSTGHLFPLLRFNPTPQRGQRDRQANKSRSDSKISGNIVPLFSVESATYT
jgi:hypothetical protein